MQQEVGHSLPDGTRRARKRRRQPLQDTREPSGLATQNFAGPFNAIRGEPRPVHQVPGQLSCDRFG